MAAALPALPGDPSGQGWSDNIRAAHKILSEAYSRGARLLRLQDQEALRLRFHSQHINEKMVPILKALDQEMSSATWVLACGEVLMKLAFDLEVAAKAADCM